MVCLISGGASGIGLAAARRIGRRMPVVLADVASDRLERAVAALVADGLEAIGVACDVRSGDDCARGVEVAERRGNLTDVVTSAGILGAGDGPLADCDMAAWNTVLDVNLSGTARLVAVAMPALLRRGGGDVVLVSSTAALTGTPGIAAYSASKAGLIGLQRSIVADYAVRGIRCNCVCPGPTDTPMSQLRGQRIPNATGDLAQPDQVAAAIEWLTLDESDWLMGGVLPLDGGGVTAMTAAFEVRR